MPPLTLEQILARSMRLPKSRAKRVTGSLFSPVLSAGAGAAASARGVQRSPDPSKRGQTLDFFGMLERDEEVRTAGRLSIHPSDGLVRNSADLLTFLQTAQRVQAWEDAIRAFASATGLSEELKAVTPPAGNTVGSGRCTSSSTAASSSTAVEKGCGGGSGGGGGGEGSSGSGLPSGATVQPSSEHVAALLDTLAAARQWPQLLSLAQYFGSQFPESLSCAVSAMIGHGRRALDDRGSQSSTSAHLASPALIEAVCALASSPALPNAAQTTTYEAALLFLRHGSVRPGEVPVTCYNVILSACEDAKDWQAALRVVRAMGPNPLQGWAAPEERSAAPASATAEKQTAEEKEGTRSGAAVAVAVAAAPPAAVASSLSPPSPDVVSYATLLATLEQANQNSIASQVLERLPPLEKEEITAFYTALVYVWSNQMYQKHRGLRR